MAYTPEFWLPDVSRRHAVAPAFGALLRADYKLFLENDVTIETLSYDETTKEMLEYDELDEPETDIYMVDGHVITRSTHKLVGIVEALSKQMDVATHISSAPPLSQHITDEQYAWSKAMTFFDDEVFQKETRGAGFNGVRYFMYDEYLQRLKRSSGPLDLEDFLDFIEHPIFLSRLHSASSGTQSFWSVPDNNSTVNVIFDSIAGTHRSEISGENEIAHFFAGQKVTAEIEARIKQIKKKNSATINESDGWEKYSTSGCPVRHTKLGPRVLDAFTDEQLAFLRDSQTMVIDDAGVINFTWDPFEATLDAIIPTIKKLVS